MTYVSLRLKVLSMLAVFSIFILAACSVPSTPQLFIAEKTMLMEVGEQRTLNFSTSFPLDDLTWTSSNPEVVSVVDGRITALNEGTSTIQVTADTGRIFDSVLITVSEPATTPEPPVEPEPEVPVVEEPEVPVEPEPEVPVDPEPEVPVVDEPEEEVITPSTIYTITITNETGAVITTLNVEAGSFITTSSLDLPENFKGFFLDEQTCEDEPFDLETPITEDLTLIQASFNDQAPCIQLDYIVLNGRPVAGSTLSVDVFPLGANVTISWYTSVNNRTYREIPGETESTFTVRPEDSGKFIRVYVVSDSNPPVVRYDTIKLDVFGTVSSGGESTPSIQGTPVVTLQDLLNQGYIPIASEADLLAINSTTEHDFATGTAFFLSTNGGLDLNYVLVTDVAFTTPLTNAVIADGNHLATNHFTGIFNGFGYSISGLEITNSSTNNRVGLFGSISGASIKNLTLSAFSVTSNSTGNNTLSERLGLLAGQATGNTLITQILITGSTISAQSGDGNRNLPQGGASSLIGYVDYGLVSSVLTISGIYANTNIELTGESSVGGLIGSVSWNQISTSAPVPSTLPPYIYLENIIYEGDITQTQQFSLIGGIIGTYRGPNSPGIGRLVLNNVLYSGTILNSDDRDESTGGIVGILHNQLKVEMNQVIFDGIITGTAQHVGGVVGRLTHQSSYDKKSLEIHDSAVFGQISTAFPPSSSTNQIFVGAIIGRDETSTSADKTSITFTSIIVSTEFLGMTIPPDHGSVHAFNARPTNITYSGIVFLERGSLNDFGNHSSNDQILPSKSSTLKNIQTFKDFNWSIELKSDDTNDSIWLIDPNTNNGYPYLRAFRDLFED
jgi:hypothetical protein